MQYETYIGLLKQKFEKHFQIDTDIEIYGNKLDMIAKFSDISGRTFITKNDIIDRCENHEYCYIKRYDTVSEDEVTAFEQFLKRIVDEQVSPGKDHMSTYVTGVIICSSMSGAANKAIEKYRYSKAYSFYLKGWCDVRLICVALDSDEIITNKDGKKIKKVYQIIS